MARKDKEFLGQKLKYYPLQQAWMSVEGADEPFVSISKRLKWSIVAVVDSIRFTGEGKTERKAREDFARVVEKTEEATKKIRGLM